MNLDELKNLLNEKYSKYCTEEFIKNDPISIPHLFGQKENIEIAGFLTASIAWGQRSTIVKNAKHLMQLLHNNPRQYVYHMDKEDTQSLRTFCHRTFNSTDLVFFLNSLSNIYKNHGGLENVFLSGYEKNHKLEEALVYFRKIFFELRHERRSEKHVANIENGASAKRLNMFLRWMVRKDDIGVDFGIWDKIAPSDLFVPLDVHSGSVARELGLLRRKQNDWKAVQELTHTLRKFDPDDPVKYDYALFGMGINEGITSTSKTWKRKE